MIFPRWWRPSYVISVVYFIEEANLFKFWSCRLLLQWPSIFFSNLDLLVTFCKHDMLLFAHTVRCTVHVWILTHALPFLDSIIGRTWCLFSCAGISFLRHIVLERCIFFTANEAACFLVLQVMKSGKANDLFLYSSWPYFSQPLRHWTHQPGPEPPHRALPGETASYQGIRPCLDSCFSSKGERLWMLSQLNWNSSLILRFLKDKSKVLTR